MKQFRCSQNFEKSSTFSQKGSFCCTLKVDEDCWRVKCTINNLVSIQDSFELIYHTVTRRAELGRIPVDVTWQDDNRRLSIKGITRKKQDFLRL